MELLVQLLVKLVYMMDIVELLAVLKHLLASYSDGVHTHTLSLSLSLSLHRGIARCLQSRLGLLL
jgi:hypothetical protein